MTEEQLSALLRLKRYEQPPPQYFDRLLQDIHRRQRAELLQRPLWKIAADRVQTFFSEHSMGHLSYAGALATVLVVGVGAIGLMTPGVKIDGPIPVVAQIPAPTSAEAPFTATGLSLAQTTPAPPVLEPPSWPPAQSGYGLGDSQPRYIIDARPASYEPSSSIDF